MELDVVWLSRLQFAMTIGFHFIFPPISIGLAWLLVLIEWKGWRNKDAEYVRLGKFFGRLLALTFAMGVATGIVMEFQFGTNWAQYAKFVGDIFGAPLAIEGVFAFFLESTFLGLYLFGRGKVSKGMHWFACLMVACGATLSAFWIIVANSWQQTPAGFVLQNGRAELDDFFAAVFNASLAPRFLHTMSASLLTGAFFMAGISAAVLLRDSENRPARKSLRLALVAGLLLAGLAIFPTGHYHAQQVARTQPEKLAAIEGLFEGQTYAPLTLAAIPTESRLIGAIRVPALLSLLAFNKPAAYVKGLNEFPPSERPPVVITFTSFHAMVGLGTLFVLILLYGTYQWYRGRVWNDRLFLKALVCAIPLPVAACELGWITAEVGRQPWIVYHILRTKDAVSTAISGGQVLFSIILFAGIYLLLGALYLYLVFRETRRGAEVLAKEDA